MLRARDRIYCDLMEALELYTRQSCLRVTATDLAVMGATLADGGVNPITGVQVIDASTCRHTLAVIPIPSARASPVLRGASTEHPRVGRHAGEPWMTRAFSFENSSSVSFPASCSSESVRSWSAELVAA